MPRRSLLAAAFARSGAPLFFAPLRPVQHRDRARCALASASESTARAHRERGYRRRSALDEEGHRASIFQTRAATVRADHDHGTTRALAPHRAETSAARATLAKLRDRARTN